VDPKDREPTNLRSIRPSPDGQRPHQESSGEPSSEPVSEPSSRHETPDDLTLIDTIGDDLTARRVHEIVLAASNTIEIARYRSLGRRAGRRRGINVHTFVTRPNPEGDVAVIISNVTPIADDDELGQRRQWARMRAAVNAVSASHSPEQP
jgi:hypothetical protein